MEEDYHTFREKLENKTIKEFTKSINENKLTFESSYATGIISFNDYHIIEMEVINKKNATSEFYIHFQYNNNAHALSLYQEFEDALIQTKEKHTLNVLLCCSGGLTTSYFAMLLNEGAQAISLDYHFDAMSFDRLYHKGSDYDVILLAPQISYKHKEAESALRHKLIIDIPASIFARYDVGAMFHHIASSLEAYKKRDSSPIDLPIKKDIHNTTTILVLGYIRHMDKTRIVYRIYDHNQILLTNEVIKSHLRLEDMRDIITMILTLYDIKMVGVAMPGIINNGTPYSESDTFDYENVYEYFKNQFDIPIVLNNDVNAMAVGQYLTQDETENLSFLFQPRGAIYSGIGNIIDGKLHTGLAHVSGESFLVMKHNNCSPQDLYTTEEGEIKMVACALNALIAMVASDKIIYYCEQIPDTKKLIDALTVDIPENVMPVIEKTIHIKDYMLLGELYLAAQYYHEHLWKHFLTTFYPQLLQ